MKSMDLPGFLFDVSYFEKVGVPKVGVPLECEAVQFRIVNGDQEKFITLYNHHNGYYGKGFEFTCPVDQSRNKEEVL